MRYKDVEFRTLDDSDRPAEIVAWQYSDSMEKEVCYTICWIKKDSEGYYIETVGDRYTEHDDMEALNHVAKYALRSLNLSFEFEQKKNYE